MNINFKDYYKILGVSSNSSQAEIKLAYRRLAFKYHPDVNKGNKVFEEKLKEINEAYEILSNASKRAAYDQYKNFVSDPPRQNTYTAYNTAPQYNYYPEEKKNNWYVRPTYIIAVFLILRFLANSCDNRSNIQFENVKIIVDSVSRHRSH